MTNPSSYAPAADRSLKGKTLFITGGSRGIGLAIAKRAAADGANVAIAAKTAKPHPKLPGTIHTAAEEIEEAGGKSLAIQMDLRNDTEVAEAVAKTVETFGGIDILINNASAVALGGVNDVPMRRIDLMHQINLRGTLLAARTCLPHLKEGTNPHILTLSPPPSLDPKWYKSTLPYTLAKMGMSFATIGLAEDFREHGIAANALWPRTAIDTAAIRHELGGDTVIKHCRTTDIVADSAHAILTRDAKTCTGNFFLDDDVLAEEGVSDLTPYAIEPGQPLILDFYLESGPGGTMDGYLRMPM
ncbi:MAG: NAD(P)-dependent oxidoreductase [Rhodospirillaceae bacterium]|nr:NAD(P)-dependent oxidoreductase [Rhodospirillaceae bacterium]